MNLVRVKDLFDIQYGNSFVLNKMVPYTSASHKKVNYVSRTEKNNGVSAVLEEIPDTKPFEAGLITVAGSGNSVLEACVQPLPFYTGYHVFVLTPKQAMSELEKLFYCHCIKRNRYKYNFGRQANKTLPDLLLPKNIPTEWQAISIEELNTINKNAKKRSDLKLDRRNWKSYNLGDLFDISASRDPLSKDLTEGGKTPYVTSSEYNNGVSSYYLEDATNKAGTITANRGGSVGYFFYQPFDYLSTPVDVRILTPKFKIDPYIGIFLKTILQKEKYRYNYSRKMGTDRLKNIMIQLPSAPNKKPDWIFMSNYIKSLKYSSSI